MNDPYDLDNQNVAPHATVGRVPYEEQSRRILIGLLGALFFILTALQVVLALTLDAESYQTVTAALAGANTVLAAALGAAIVYYFQRKP